MEPFQKQAFLQALSQNGQCEIDVYGSSMLPCIRNGDRVVVAKPDPKPRIGQVVGVFAGNQLIVHRTVFHWSTGESTRVWIQGDSLPHSLVCMDYAAVCCTVRRVLTPPQAPLGTGPLALAAALFRSYSCRLFRRLAGRPKRSLFSRCSTILRSPSGRTTTPQE